jgi:hypothetical protein
MLMVSPPAAHPTLLAELLAVPWWLVLTSLLTSAGCAPPSYTEEELCDLVAEHENGDPKTVALLCDIDGYGEDMSECEPGARGRWASKEAIFAVALYCQDPPFHIYGDVEVAPTFEAGRCDADRGTTFRRFFACD